MQDEAASWCRNKPVINNPRTDGDWKHGWYQTFEADKGKGRICNKLKVKEGYFGSWNPALSMP